MEMIKNLTRANFLTTGLAMFAMFFGSGNLIFPVGVGQVAGEQNGWAILGLFITAVFLPFATLTLMLLFNGNYDKFFQKVGVVPGKVVAFSTLALIGPFGVLPRCIAFSYSTFSIYFDSVGLFEYAIIACILVFVCSVKKNDVVALIGNLLTPILIISLIVIIVKGLNFPKIPGESLPESNLSMVMFGFVEGYKTFDIFAALFFATAIMPAFHDVLGKGAHTKELMKLAVRSSLVGMVLLFLVYAGLSYVAANLSGGLVGVSGDKLLGTISNMTMGSTAGLFANLAVSLACLTTAISLAVVSAEFFKREVFFNRISYVNSLLLTMIITLGFSWLGFSGIMRLVLPILMVLCPAVITLIIANALNYFYGFKYIKAPVYAVFVVSLIYTILS
jgi:LIVCS family branched-chain amino acid:cation transporter